MKFKISNKGSIFILVTWILLFLSIFAFSIGFSTRRYLQFVQKLEIRETLRDVAEAGAKKAMYLLNVKREGAVVVDSLNQEWSQNPQAFKNVIVGKGSFTVSYEFSENFQGIVKSKARDDGEKTKTGETRYGAVDEESKININQVSDPVVLTTLFKNAAGLDEGTAYTIAVSVLDFRDQDEFSYDEGAESQYYKSLTPPYRAKNAAFDTLEELLFVKGITPEVLSKISPFITIYSDGTINLNTASGYVLQAIGFKDTLVKKIIEFRMGPDQLSGTPDDNLFVELPTVMDQVNQTYYLDDIEKGNFTERLAAGKVQLFSRTFEIQSIATLKGRKEMLKIICVYERQGPVKKWNEQYFVKGES